MGQDSMGEEGREGTSSSETSTSTSTSSSSSSPDGGSLDGVGDFWNASVVGGWGSEVWG